MKLLEWSGKSLVEIFNYDENILWDLNKCLRFMCCFKYLIVLMVNWNLCGVVSGVVGV